MTTPPPPQRAQAGTASEPVGRRPRSRFLTPAGSALRHAQSSLAAARARLAPPPRPAADLRPLVERVDALEAMIEGLQDAVDRESRRHDARLDELARRLEPAELARVLSEDARRRGL
jgi:hypothetical protein